MGKSNRFLNYSCVVYPDDVRFNPDSDNFCGFTDIFSACADLKLNVFISPLHDRDVTSTGEKKEPHYHVIVAFDSVKTIDQAREIGSRICAKNNVMEVVQSMRGYCRYLCHLDDANKFQYNISDVVSYGCLDYIEKIKSSSSKYNDIGEMMDFCKINEIYKFSDLLEYARDNRPDDWFRVLVDQSSYIMREYIKSLYWDRNCISEVNRNE